jgi:uncharacterized protein (DUF2236 family)
VFAAMSGDGLGDQQSVGLYGPDTITWRVNREAVLLAGGGRALLLQVAHPLVAAGVEQHSDYERHPWRRLVRTLDITTKIVFGDPETSAEASRQLQRRHTRVQGTSEGGVPYDARDPKLLVWVWATLVDSSLLLHQRCVRPLSSDEVERYYQEQKRFAYACGVPEGGCPPDYGDFSHYWDRMVAEELEVTDAARAVAGSIMRPAVPALVRPVFVPNSLITIGLLPPQLRADYGFPWSRGRQRMLDLTLATLRRTARLLPPVMRQFPEARTAARRARTSGPRPADTEPRLA